MSEPLTEAELEKLEKLAREAAEPWNRRSVTTAEWRYIMAANPQTILRLVADVRRLRESIEDQLDHLDGLLAAHTWEEPAQLALQSCLRDIERNLRAALKGEPQ